MELPSQSVRCRIFERPVWSDFFRHDKWFAVFTREELIRLAVVGEALGFWIHRQDRAQHQRRLVQVHLVRAEMGFYPAQTLGQVTVSFDGVKNAFRRQGLAEAIG